MKFVFATSFGALLLAASTAPALAQTTPAPADTARFYKHHLGLTASPMLDKFFSANRSLPVGLLYKRQTSSGRLTRFGIHLNQNLDYRLDGSPQPNPYIYNTTVFDIDVRVGREYAYSLSRRWTATAGADVLLGYRYDRLHYEGGGSTSFGEPTFKQQTETDRYYRLAIAPFAGLRYSFHKRLYGSAEATVYLAFSRLEFKIRGSTIMTRTGELYDSLLTGDTRYNRFSLGLRPVSQLTLHYLVH